MVKPPQVNLTQSSTDGTYILINTCDTPLAQVYIRQIYIEWERMGTT